MSTNPTATASEPDQPPVLLRELDDSGVLLLTFNRPERNNGWTIELEEAYFGALIDAANDPSVRTIVVTGAGKSFCPGLDMLALEDAAKRGTPLASQRRWPMTTARLIPKPVIGAINGATAGIGLIQAACCDIRFASRTAKFTTAFARRGLPAENSLSWLLPRLVGTGNAMDLLLSARVVSADDALAMGLVNRMTEPDDLVPAALAYARDLAANCSPFSMATIKAQVHDDLEARQRGIPAAGARRGLRTRREPGFPGGRHELPRAPSTAVRRLRCRARSASRLVPVRTHRPAPNTRAIIAVLGYCGALVSITQSVALPLLSELPKRLGASVSDVSWVATSALLSGHRPPCSAGSVTCTANGG